MKKFWNNYNDDVLYLVTKCMLAALVLVSIVGGFLAFRGDTVNLKMAFYSVTGLLIVIALK